MLFRHRHPVMCCAIPLPTSAHCPALGHDLVKMPPSFLKPPKSQRRAAAQAEASAAVARARDAEQRMADAETQYAPLAQQAGAMQRQLAEAQAAAQAAVAEAARLSQELAHSRRGLELTILAACISSSRSCDASSTTPIGSRDASVVDGRLNDHMPASQALTYMMCIRCCTGCVDTWGKDLQLRRHMLRTTCAYARICRSAIDAQAAHTEARTAAQAEVERLTAALEAAAERAATAERRVAQVEAAAQQTSEQLVQYTASWGDMQSQHEQLSAQNQHLQSQNQQLQASLQVRLQTRGPALACRRTPARIVDMTYPAKVEVNTDSDTANTARAVFLHRGSEASTFQAMPCRRTCSRRWQQTRSRDLPPAATPAPACGRCISSSLSRCNCGRRLHNQSALRRRISSRW